MSDTEKTEITKVMMVIREFLSETRDVVSSAEKSQQWIIQFRNTLCYQDLEAKPNKFALKLLAEARGYSNSQRKKQQMRWVRESLAKDGLNTPSKKQLEERWMLIYGSEENLQAESNDQVPTQVSTNNGDAATREGAEDCHHPINGAIAHPTTVSKNVSTPAISTNRRRTGGPSLSQTSSLPPVRHADPDVLSLAYSGEFGNVRLTQAQYNELGIKFGNQQKLNRAIDSLSCQIENGEKNPQNHYAELVKWANYRDDMEERKEEESSKPKMTEMEKSWIEAMKRVEAM